MCVHVDITGTLNLPFVSPCFFFFAPLTPPLCRSHPLPYICLPKLMNSSKTIIRKSPNQRLFICQVSHVKANRLLSIVLNQSALPMPSSFRLFQNCIFEILVNAKMVRFYRASHIFITVSYCQTFVTTLDSRQLAGLKRFPDCWPVNLVIDQATLCDIQSTEKPQQKTFGFTTV